MDNKMSLVTLSIQRFSRSNLLKTLIGVYCTIFVDRAEYSSMCVFVLCSLKNNKKINY
jgi:hypothetical protein